MQGRNSKIKNLEKSDLIFPKFIICENGASVFIFNKIISPCPFPNLVYFRTYFMMNSAVWIARSVQTFVEMLYRDARSRNEKKNEEI